MPGKKKPFHYVYGSSFFFEVYHSDCRSLNNIQLPGSEYSPVHQTHRILYFHHDTAPCMFTLRHWRRTAWLRWCSVKFIQCHRGSVNNRKKQHKIKIKNTTISTICPSCSFSLSRSLFFVTIVNSNSPLKAWPCAVWQQIAAAWRQDATYHQGTRWLFNFTLPVAKTPVSVERHNGSYAGGADVLVKGCKEGGGWAGRRTAERRNGAVCVCVRVYV